MQATIEPPPLSLYVHLPWCVRKCPYCDFNSHAARGEVPEAAYVDALLADLERDAEGLGARPVRSVFIGGGTPSLLSVAAVERLLAGIAARVTLAPGCEITLEANPGAADAEHAQVRHRGGGAPQLPGGWRHGPQLA